MGLPCTGVSLPGPLGWPQCLCDHGEVVAVPRPRVPMWYHGDAVLVWCRSLLPPCPSPNPFAATLELYIDANKSHEPWGCSWWHLVPVGLSLAGNDDV